MSAVEQRLMTSRGHYALRHWHAGAGGVPVLAVHGWLDNAATFDRLAPLLHDAPLHAVDLPGHGFSDPRPAGMRYHNADFLDDLVAVLDGLFPDTPVTLLGHSLGAGLCLMIAALFPERVHKLVLLEGLGPVAANPEDYLAQTREAVLALPAQASARKPVASLEVAVQARRRGMTGPLSESAARLLCTRSLETGADGQLYWRSDKRLRLPSLIRYQEAQVRACIAAIRVPTLVICGEQGLPQASAQYRERLAHFVQAQVVTLPGGHHLHLDESPDAVAAVVRAFLAG